MSYRRKKIIDTIADNLAFLSKSTALNNKIGLFDNNRVAQEFFATLFELVFGYDNLKELDKLHGVGNHPAIDLGDNNAKIAFQITTASNSGKIKDTINKFIEHKLYKTYTRLVIFIIGEKQKTYQVTFDTKSKFIFNKEKDIWDDNYLIKEIDKIKDNSLLENIQIFLEENLSEFKFPESLTDADIKKCIQILKRDFGSSKTMENNLKRSNENFMEEKNRINNISWQFFKEKIRSHLGYNKMILDFLQNEINKKSRNDYLEVSQAIQLFYQNSASKYSSFEDVFKNVFGKINGYNDEMSGLDIKIKILLHNMYFNCDIGNNPKDNVKTN